MDRPRKFARLPGSSRPTKGCKLRTLQVAEGVCKQVQTHPAPPYVTASVSPSAPRSSSPLHRILTSLEFLSPPRSKKTWRRHSEKQTTKQRSPVESCCFVTAEIQIEKQRPAPAAGVFGAPASTTPGVFLCVFSEPRSFHCHTPPACLITSVPEAFLIHTGKKKSKVLFRKN